MIEDKQKTIINSIDETEEIKRFKELESIIKNNEEYKKIKKEFDKKDISNEEIIKLRKNIFEIKEVKEYAKLESDIRLYSKNISNIISSIVDDESCIK